VVAARVRTGVVGAGVFGAFHAAKHAASPRAELVGLHDLDADRAAAVADRSGAKAFQDFDELLANVDALVIASPAPSHFEFARAALVAGRHVYVEKPLALTTVDADALIALAQRRSLVLQVGHQERFVLDALGAVRADKSPTRAEFSRCGPPSGRGEDISVVFDLMIHDLDIARRFGFSDPTRVAAAGDRHETIATLNFEDGRTCTFIASRRAEARRRHLIATYEDGAIEIDFSNRRVLNTTPAILAETAPAFADPLGASVEAFFASILDGKKTAIDGAAGRGALDWALKIEDARERLNTVAASDKKRRIA
jgi:predicted dehydrogenase